MAGMGGTLSGQTVDWGIRADSRLVKMGRRLDTRLSLIL